MDGLVIACVHSWCWRSFMRVRFRSWAVAVNGRLCHRPWALDVHGWVVGVRKHSMFMGGVLWSSMVGRPWALDACGWGVVVVNRGVGCVVSHLWAVEVVRGSFVAVVGSCRHPWGCGRLWRSTFADESWSSVGTILMSGGSWSSRGVDHPCGRLSSVGPRS